MVQRLAKLTGLSLQHAYWLSVVVNFAHHRGLYHLGGEEVPARSIPKPHGLHTESAWKMRGRQAKRLIAAWPTLKPGWPTWTLKLPGLRASAEKEAAAEEARIQAAAEEDARKIVRSAEEEIAAAAKAVRRELTAYAASMAVSLAAKQIRVDRASDEALVQDFAGQAGRRRQAAERRAINGNRHQYLRPRLCRRGFRPPFGCRQDFAGGANPWPPWSPAAATCGRSGMRRRFPRNRSAPCWTPLSPANSSPGRCATSWLC